MLENFTVGNRVLDGEDFVKDEVQYNLLHLITGFPNSIRVKSTRGDLIFAQSGGYNPWLWISREVAAEQRKLLVQELVEHVKDHDFPGISAEPETARLFAEAYCEVKGKLYHTAMKLESYQCPVVKRPVGVSGQPALADADHIPVIAEFMAGFSEDAFGVPTQPDSMLAIAEEMVRSGNLYLWQVGGQPVSMAKIAHRSGRYSRINEVYTERAYRKLGYGSAIVAELCDRVFREQLKPMLYADAGNPNSNKVYQSLGFVEAGSIADIKFQ